jgi:hypothetical protein
MHPKLEGKCVPILERALEIWKDPKKRTTGAYRRSMEGSYCALGALKQATADVNGVVYEEIDTPAWYRDYVNYDELAGLLGYPDRDPVIQTNDYEKNGGPAKMYARMKEALRRAKGETA